MRAISLIDTYSWNDRPLDYDCFVATVGFESRATFVAEAAGIRAAQRWAVGFQANHVLNYESNRQWFRDGGYRIEEPTDDQFPSVVAEIARSTTGDEHGETRICIDISSQTRLRIAHWVEHLRRLSGPSTLIVDFVYSCANFSPPPTDVVANQDLGPLFGFAGWAEPELPTTVVVGVGYERNKALGAVRFIDPDDVWTFIPSGHQSKYSTHIERANRDLWSLIAPEKRLSYHVFRPMETFVNLESFVCGLLRKSKIILVPLGPKIFALNCLLVGCLHRDIAVWRVSSGGHGIPSDRVSNRKVVGLRICLTPEVAARSPLADVGRLPGRKELPVRLSSKGLREHVGDIKRTG